MPGPSVTSDLSPRSTVLIDSNISAMNGGNVNEGLKTEKNCEDPLEVSQKGESPEIPSVQNKSEVDVVSTPSAGRKMFNQSSPSQGVANPQNNYAMTPQGAYYGYTIQSQGTPEPTYDASSFFQQPNGFGHNQAPSSPPRTVGMIPPASPLFPRVVMDHGATSPQLPYMTTPPLSSMYGHYAVNMSSTSPDNGSAWNDRNYPHQSQNNGYQLPSPLMQGMPMSYGMTFTRSGVRNNSFDDTMLPPSVLTEHDVANPAHSPYGGSQGSSVPGGSLFAGQQSWMQGYGADMYSTPGSPLQPRPTVPMSAYAAAQLASLGMRGVQQQFGQQFPASSPGPPIQTTASNKGPEGANLFIFHIPNHFTNLDMYQLFCPYGNLLSVRIMVEKESGRSRGFGFVSFDAPESAALAIKELNGFAIGNKRLKVQHKQIRPKDLLNDHDSGFDISNDALPQFASLPPSGAMASQTMWYNKNATCVDDGKVHPDEGTELTSASTSNEFNPPTESPLATMGSLQNALPDVAGNVSVPE